MANADFEKQNSTGGFSAGNYRAAQAGPAQRSLTPTQQKLAALEKGLPAVLKNQAAAALVLVIVAVVGVFGVGGAKLHAKYTQVTNAVTSGVAEDVALSSDYTIRAQLSARINAASSVVTQATNALGAGNSYVQTAQAAIEAFNKANAGDDLGEMYDANAALGAAIDAMYAAVQETSENPLQMGAIQTSYSDFTSAGRMLANLSYNTLAQTYNDQAAGFPANVIGTLWGCGKAELFA